jgi:hypothetical protein
MNPLIQIKIIDAGYFELFLIQFQIQRSFGTDQDPGRTKWLEIECHVLRGPTDQIRLDWPESGIIGMPVGSTCLAIDFIIVK